MRFVRSRLSAGLLLTAAALFACQAETAVVPRSPIEKTPPPVEVRVDPALPGDAAVPLAKSFRFQNPPQNEPIAASEAPMSLTASDGTGLTLVRLEAQAVVEDPLAFTELHLTFENPQARVIEGQFRITLPQGASISRFAMKIGDRWQEGEVVEKQAARRAYEDFLHRRQDPALLEQAAANEFSARVFPIPANGRKELILSYSQELAQAGQAYRLPLRGLPKLGSIEIRALVGHSKGTVAASTLGGTSSAHEVVEVSKTSWVPDRDFEVATRSDAARVGLRHGNIVVARVAPVVATVAAELPSLLILVDTSASRALGFSREVTIVEELVKGLRDGAGDVPLAVACFDQTVASIFEGRAGAFGDAEIKRIRDRRALGASNLEAALRWAAEHAKSGQYKRVVLVTDGVATAGEVEGDRLLVAAKALGDAGVERLDAIGVGGIRDEATLGRLVTAGLAQAGAVIDGDLAMQAIARKLTTRTASGVTIAVEGAAWTWPSKLDGVQAGDSVLVYADLPESMPFSLIVGGKPFAAGLTLATAEKPLLERAWIHARIAKLEDQRDRLGAADPDLREALRKQIIDLSTRFRVLSSHTALLVLETEQDYQRFNIDRRALADILTVGATGLTVVNRGANTVPVAQVAGPRPKALRAPELNPADGSKGGEARAPQREAKDDRDGDDDKKKEAVDQDLSGADLAAGGAAEAPAMAEREEAAKSVAAEREAERRPEPAPAPSVVTPPPAAPPMPARRQLRDFGDAIQEEGADGQARMDPYSGPFKVVMNLIAGGKTKAALEKALAWREENAGDVLALVALGETCEALGDLERAARAYGSIVDLFPARADLRRFAGQRLERLKNKAGLEFAIDTYRKAVEQRGDHPASHRLLAFALLRAGRASEAFEAISVGQQRSYPDGRFAGVPRILSEDLGLIAAAVLKAEPKRRDEIRGRLERAGASLESVASVRFVLNWETDANDVDFHIHDAKGGHAYYSSRELPSGGELYADVTTGYGPECFTIRNPVKARAYPYRLQAHYYSRGPMGYGMGKLEIIEHDGKGGFAFEERPFIVMQDQAFVELGAVKGPLKTL